MGPFIRRHYRRAREQRAAAAERRRLMLEDQAHVAAMAKAVLAQLNAAQMAALREEIKTELLAEVEAEAVEQAKAALEDTLRRREEQLTARFAKLQADYESDIESRVEAGVAEGLRAAERDWGETRATLRAQRTEARQARDAAEHQLLSLLRQLLSDRGRYLKTAYIGEVDQVGLNQILTKHGWRLRSKATYTERFMVKTHTAENTWAMRSLFWLEGVAPDGPVDDDDDDAEEATPPPEAAGPRAWPEVSGI